MVPGTGFEPVQAEAAKFAVWWGGCVSVFLATVYDVKRVSPLTSPFVCTRRSRRDPRVAVAVSGNHRRPGGCRRC